jgi:peroxiredoxin
MDKHSEMDVNRWVDEQVAKLNSDGKWQPNVGGALGRFNEQRARIKAGARKWRWGAAAVMTACVVLFAFPEPRTVAQRFWVPCLDACQSLLLKRANVAGVAAADKTLKTGKPAPNFALKDASSADIRLSDYRGKVVLLNFWATWCHGCMVEIPWFMEFKNKYKNGGLAVIGVSMDDDGWKSVKPFMEQKKMNYTVVIGTEDLARQYGVTEMPMTLLIDRNGKIAASHSGVVDPSAWESEIRRLLENGAKNAGQ